MLNAHRASRSRARFTLQPTGQPVEQHDTAKADLPAHDEPLREAERADATQSYLHALESEAQLEATRTEHRNALLDQVQAAFYPGTRSASSEASAPTSQDTETTQKVEAERDARENGLQHLKEAHASVQQHLTATQIVAANGQENRAATEAGMLLDQPLFDAIPELAGRKIQNTLFRGVSDAAKEQAALLYLNHPEIRSMVAYAEEGSFHGGSIPRQYAELQKDVADGKYTSALQEIVSLEKRRSVYHDWAEAQGHAIIHPALSNRIAV